MARRGHNEGSVYREAADGRWTAAVDMGWIDGRRRRKKIHGETRAEVARKLTEALKRRDDGLPATIDKRTVGQFLAGWLDATKPTLKPGTYARYEQYVRVHAEPEIGSIPLSKLSPADLQALYAKRLAAGASPRTVGHLHRVLHRAFGQAVRWDVLLRNPVERVDPPRVTRTPISTLKAEQARSLLDAAKGQRLEALYVLALTTGARQGELLALRWRDTDMERHSIQIRGSLRRSPDGFSIGETKSSKSRRIELTATAVEALRRHRAAQNEERLRLGELWDDHDLVFANELGRPIEAGNLLRRSFAPLLEAAACPRIRFHDLRHTTATLLLERGVPVKAVSELLGHASIGTTLDLYAHVTETMQRQIITTMESVVGSTA
jgi:integrase